MTTCYRCAADSAVTGVGFVFGIPTQLQCSVGSLSPRGVRQRCCKHKQLSRCNSRTQELLIWGHIGHPGCCKHVLYNIHWGGMLRNTLAAVCWRAQVANVSVEQLVSGGRVGDVRILPQPVFGCPTAVFHAADPLPYVYHMFMGSWKIAQPSGLKVFIRKLSSSLHRPQQLKEHSTDTAAAGTAAEATLVAGTGAAEVTGGAGAKAGAGGAAKQVLLNPNKHPRRPILEEQILQHMAQQHEQERKQLQQHRKQSQTPQQQQAQPQVEQDTAAASSARPSAAAAAQHQDQQQGSAAAAASSKLSTRKLRASQAQLVRAVTVPVPNTVQGLFREPEVPSRVVSGMPTLSLLVVAALLVTLYKRQRGTSCTGLWTTARDGIRAARSAVGLPPRSPLTRPHSRSHLTTGCNGNALLVCTTQSPQPSAAGAAGNAVGGSSSKGSLPLVHDAVCYSSSQHAARGHGHKRSWGSASSFQL